MLLRSFKHVIEQQPGPVACSSCESNGYVECKWCRGTGFFILGNNLLCEVPSRNTTCVICAGKVVPSIIPLRFKYSFDHNELFVSFTFLGLCMLSRLQRHRFSREMVGRSTTTTTTTTTSSFSPVKLPLSYRILFFGLIYIADISLQIHF